MDIKWDKEKLYNKDVDQNAQCDTQSDQRLCSSHARKAVCFFSDRYSYD